MLFVVDPFVPHENQYPESVNGLEHLWIHSAGGHLALSVGFACLAVARLYAFAATRAILPELLDDFRARSVQQTDIHGVADIANSQSAPIV